MIPIVKRLKIHYSKKLEEQTFDIRFFSLVRIQGTWVLPGETSTSHITGFLTKQEHLFHLDTWVLFHKGVGNIFGVQVKQVAQDLENFLFFFFAKIPLIWYAFSETDS